VSARAACGGCPTTVALANLPRGTVWGSTAIFILRMHVAIMLFAIIDHDVLVPRGALV
jgi:hypothetical protein